jgi:hypothetical protein
MKPLITFGLAVCLFTLRASGQEPPKKPGPEHKKLEIMAGRWRYEEEHFESPFGAVGKATYGSEAEMILGGFFAEERGHGNTPDGPFAWVAVTAYDPEKGYYQFVYDNTGFGSRPWKGEVGTAKVQGNEWTWTWNQDAKGKTYHCKSVTVFSEDGKTQTYEWFYSEDGVKWKRWSRGRGTKG